jgi:hypothetical protein
VLVDVVAMLEVTVAIVDVVGVIAVCDHLAAVSLGVGAPVAGVHRLLGMTLVAVHVVDVVLVLDGVAPVASVVLVIDGLSVGSHLSSLPAVLSTHTSSGPMQGAARCGCSRH